VAVYWVTYHTSQLSNIKFFARWQTQRVPEHSNWNYLTRLCANFAWPIRDRCKKKNNYERAKIFWLMSLRRREATERRFRNWCARCERLSHSQSVARSRCDDDLDSRGCCIWAFKSGSNYFQTAALVLGQREGRSTTSTSLAFYTMVSSQRSRECRPCAHATHYRYRQTRETKRCIFNLLLFLLALQARRSVNCLDCLKIYQPKLKFLLGLSAL
jgi:hypothetical protein